MNEARQQPLSRFDACWLAEAVRLHEQSGGSLSREFSEPLSSSPVHPFDAEEVWLLRRARVLGEDLGMEEVIRSWHLRAGLVLGVLGVLAVLSGFTAALGFFGAENRQVNVIWTLMGLIGFPLIALLIWLVSVITAAGSGASGGIFGQLWLWLVSRWPGAGAAAANHELTNEPVARALAALMKRSGLGFWWISVITHSLWLLLLTATTIAMLLALSLRGYDFVLETTILSPQVFGSLVHGFGAVPGLIGFTVPDADMITAALAGDVSSELARRAWSSWLVGGLLVYAVLPRLLVWALSLGRLLLVRAHLRLDLSMPGFADLLAREACRDSPGVVDAAPPAPTVRRVSEMHRVPGRGAVLLGLELNNATIWPPLGLASARPTVVIPEVIDSREQRRAMLSRFKAEPPARLLVACNAALSPDRGTLEWLVDISGHAGELRVWLVDTQLQADPERMQIWKDNLDAIGLKGPRVLSDETAAFNWLSHHD